MRFGAAGLPAGLSIDSQTGRISGVLEAPGTYLVKLSAENTLGRAERDLRIVAGERLALTPPMGYNTWNCWGSQIDDAIIRKNAEALVKTGLSQHGWTYINIDDGWAGGRGGKYNGLIGNQKFPDMRALCDYIHGLGLKAGLYSTAYRLTYEGSPGGSTDDPEGRFDSSLKPPNGRQVGKYRPFYNDARQFADWGVDYLKFDWWVAGADYAQEMSDALRVSGRDIVLSICNGAGFTWMGSDEHADRLSRVANLWRTGVDIVDTWGSVVSHGFTQDHWAHLAAPGRWNDPDMLVVGRLGWGKNQHPTRLTPDEQYTHISMWSLLSAPLLLGCDLTRLDDFTLNLLTNDEVLDVDQDPLGYQARLVSRPQQGQTEIWIKEMEDGSKVAGLFNLAGQESRVRLAWTQAGVSGPQKVRDLWRQKDLGVFARAYETAVPAHGVVLVRLSSVEPD
jgi:alpha-galactosidase